MLASIEKTKEECKKDKDLSTQKESWMIYNICKKKKDVFPFIYSLPNIYI